MSSEPSLGVREAAGTKQPARLPPCLPVPGELAHSPLESGAKVAAGRGFGAPPRVPAPLPSAHRLATNSPTRQLPDFRKATAGGAPPRSGPHHCSPIGGRLALRGPAAPARARKHREQAGPRGARRSAASSEEGGGGSARLSGRGAAAAAVPPRSGVAVARPGSPAGERRKCRGVGAGPAPRRLFVAALLPPPGGRADARAGGGAAEPAGRGGADRPR